MARAQSPRPEPSRSGSDFSSPRFRPGPGRRVFCCAGPCLGFRRKFCAESRILRLNSQNFTVDRRQIRRDQAAARIPGPAAFAHPERLLAHQNPRKQSHQMPCQRTCKFFNCSSCPYRFMIQRACTSARTEIRGIESNALSMCSHVCCSCCASVLPKFCSCPYRFMIQRICTCAQPKIHGIAAEIALTVQTGSPCQPDQRGPAFRLAVRAGAEARPGRASWLAARALRTSGPGPGAGCGPPSATGSAHDRKEDEPGRPRAVGAPERFAGSGPANRGGERETTRGFRFRTRKFRSVAGCGLVESELSRAPSPRIPEPNANTRRITQAARLVGLNPPLAPGARLAARRGPQVRGARDSRGRGDHKRRRRAHSGSEIGEPL